MAGKEKKGKERGKQKRVEREQEPGLVRVSKERWREESEKSCEDEKEEKREQEATFLLLSLSPSLFH